MTTPSLTLAPVDIVVGVDGSDNSEQAVDTALSIAEKHGCSVRLIGAFTVPVIPARHAQETSHDYHRSLGRAAQDRLDADARHAQNAGIDITAQVVEGDAGGVLVEASGYAKLTVIGKRGRNQLATRLLGTVSGRLPAHSQCPVLVVPLRCAGSSPSHRDRRTRTRSRFGRSRRRGPPRNAEHSGSRGIANRVFRPPRQGRRPSHRSCPRRAHPTVKTQKLPKNAPLVLAALAEGMATIPEIADTRYVLSLSLFSVFASHEEVRGQE